MFRSFSQMTSYRDLDLSFLDVSFSRIQRSISMVPKQIQFKLWSPPLKFPTINRSFSGSPTKTMNRVFTAFPKKLCKVTQISILPAELATHRPHCVGVCTSISHAMYFIILWRPCECDDDNIGYDGDEATHSGCPTAVLLKLDDRDIPTTHL
jgi:hypothetical protein